MNITMAYLWSGVISSPSPSSATIDVYWLEDDGGLTAILPLLRQRSSLFSKTSIRIFSRVCGPNEEEAREQLALLMRKLRINTSEINMLTTLKARPNPVSVDWFDELELLTSARTSDFLDNREFGVGEEPITLPELMVHNSSWTNYYLRLGEIIAENSSNAAAIFVPLRIPDNNDDAQLYMAWLEALSRNIHRPIFFVRANDDNVLTAEA